MSKLFSIRNYIKQYCCTSPNTNILKYYHLLGIILFEINSIVKGRCILLQL